MIKRIKRWLVNYNRQALAWKILSNKATEQDIETYERLVRYSETGHAFGPERIFDDRDARPRQGD